MTSSITKLESQALQLAPEDRVSLADRLLACVLADSEVDDAWSQEAERRLAELENGIVADLSLEAAIAKARVAIR